MLDQDTSGNGIYPMTFTFQPVLTDLGKVAGAPQRLRRGNHGLFYGYVEYGQLHQQPAHRAGQCATLN